ncbi:unnamed protein product [Urochloa humidicola]
MPPGPSLASQTQPTPAHTRHNPQRLAAAARRRRDTREEEARAASRSLRDLHPDPKPSPPHPFGRRRVGGITASVAVPRRGPAAAQVEPTGTIASVVATSPAPHGGRGALPSAGGSPSDLLFLAGGGRPCL